MPSYAKFFDDLMSAPIPDGAKIVFCRLLDFQQIGFCNPKIETLAKKTGRSAQSAKRALRWLRQNGFLQVKWGQRQSTYQIAENWRILLGQNRPTEPNPVGSKSTNTLGQNRPTEISGPYYSSDSFYRQEAAAAALVSRTRERASANGQPAAAAAPPSEKTKPSELCRELLSRHPHPQQPAKAEEELQRALQSASTETIRERHAAWCSYWEANPKHFVPHLWRWFADGDWLTTPKKPPSPMDSFYAAAAKVKPLTKGAGK